MKKTVSLILIIALLAGLMPSVFAASYTWENINTSTGVYITYDGRGMPFKPADKYISMQNPPDFSWPYVNSATGYDLKICSDKALANIVYEKKGLTNNFYNFSRTFKTGVDYWWSVKYYKNGGESEWSTARRFKIDPDAYEFVMPETEVLLSRISNTHPRIFTTKENLSSFRAIKEDNEKAKTIYNNYVNNAVNYAAAGVIPTEPVLNEEYWDSEKNTYKDGQYENYLADMKRCKSLSGTMLSQILICGFGYLLSGEKEIGNHAKNLLLALSEWDIEGPTSYVFDDQVHREVIYKSAMAYDWIFDCLTEAEAKTIRDFIVERITYVYKKNNSTSCIETLMTSIRKNPYDSHGWTAIGYLGIAAYALVGDFGTEEDLAKSWLEIILPTYAANMQPWSTEDGGWSQGTDYWRYSTQSSKEFIDILAHGNVINLYDKVWAKNEPLWTMYAYPKGSYGSFGDQSNRVKAESAVYARNSLGKTQYFGSDSVARWLSLEQGVISNDMTNYIVSTTMDEEKTAPTEYPLSHEFKDIGWAVMTDNLIDENRVQLTFKSSAYGSFNHSHADQNSFIIQGFGENLAIKSGYYDYYHSPHDSNITRPTFAHNSITVDGGYGQQDDRFNAKGNLSQFVNGLDFDSLTGEAKDAYKKSNYSSYAYGADLDKFDRNIIYIRPDVFIVIDDLDAAGNGSSSFEWWLNAEHEMEYGQNHALIKEGDARLKANVFYPQSVTSKYYDTFENPVNNQVYTPTSGYEDDNVQTRISFATEKLPKTKMIVSMSVFEAGGAEKLPAVEYYTDYVKLTYPEGTVVLVSLKDKTEEVTAGGITFKGAAVTYNTSSIMLTNGTYLKFGSEELINADKSTTAVLGMGQICLSSDDDFNVSVDSNNLFIKIESVLDLKDAKKRNLSSAVGITASDESGKIYFSAQKGNYTILNGEAGVVSPGQVKAENPEYLKSRDDKAAIYWTKKTGRSYDIKIDDEVYENVSEYPFIFNLAEDISSVFIREKLGKIKGEWSKPIFVSKYEKEKLRPVIFSETTEGGETFVKAEMEAFPGTKDFEMNMAEYTKNLRFNAYTKGSNNSDIFSVKMKKESDSVYKTLFFENDIFPRIPAATYKSDSTALSAIYADGKLIDGFDDENDNYKLVFKKGQKFFPFITAQVKDSSSKAEVEYDFGNLKAIITVESSSGRKRTVTLQYSLDMNDIHMVCGVSETSTQPVGFLQKDTGTVSSEGGSGWRSQYGCGRLMYKKENADGVLTDYQFEPYFMYGDLHGNSGEDMFGSRLFTDRDPAKQPGNHLEAEYVPERFKGYDYFVISHAFYDKLAANNKYPGLYFWFRAKNDVEVVVLSTVEQPSFEDYGFRYQKSDDAIQGRYMDTVGPEDYFYNVDIMGRPADEAGSNGKGNYYIKNFDTMSLWANVNPLPGYSTYADYQADTTLNKDSFVVAGDCTKFIASSNFKYEHEYTKVYEVDETLEISTEIKVPLDDVKTKAERFVILVRPVMPKPFYEK